MVNITTHEERPELSAESLLRRHGWLGPSSASKGEYTQRQIQTACQSYQKFNGLVANGRADAATLASLRQPRICNLPDRGRLRGGLVRWPGERITWATSGRLPGISSSDQLVAFALAWSYWGDVSAVEPIFVANQRTANVIMCCGQHNPEIQTPIGCDGLNSLMAGSQFRVQFNRARKWVIAESPEPGQDDLVGLAVHGIGHALGIPHLRFDNVMSPLRVDNFRRPRVRDIVAVVRRYGVPPEFLRQNNPKLADGTAPATDPQAIPA